jgi:Rad3-related DNA helicase
MSGTLRPFALMESKMGTTFDSKIVALPEIEKWKNQLIFAKLSNIFHFSTNKKIKYTFSTRSDQLFHKNCVRFISETSKSTNEGVLVFVPSYSVLEIFRKTIYSNQVLKDNFERSKTIFFEKKGESSQFLMSKFKVKRPKVSKRFIQYC